MTKTANKSKKHVNKLLSQTIKHYDLPFLLTCSRMAAVLFMPLLCVSLLGYNNLWVNFFVMLCTIGFATTDYFDGYFARKYNQTTDLGAQLDPIADKLFFLGCWLGLVAVQKVYVLWPAVFLARDIFIMGLRSIALKRGVQLSVSPLAKVKTAAQTVLICWIILNPYVHATNAGVLWWNAMQEFLLIVSLSLTLFTAYQYAYKLVSKAS